MFLGGFRRAFAIVVGCLVAGACRGDAGPERVHPLRFFLHPRVVPDVAFAKTVLPRYVADLNRILSKNTLRRFSFDAETDLVIWTTWQTGQLVSGAFETDALDPAADPAGPRFYRARERTAGE